MGLQSDRHVDPVQVAQPQLDQVRMRRETDVPAPGRETLLASGVVEDVEVGVGMMVSVRPRNVWSVFN